MTSDGQHSVHPTTFCWGGVETLTKFLKRGQEGGLTGSQFLEGG